MTIQTKPETAASGGATMPQTTAVVPVLWTQRETADYLGKSESWLERDRWAGPTIPYVKLGRSVRYRAADVVAYAEANVREAV